jgi:MFS family permease
MSEHYKYYVLGILTSVMTLTYLDRVLLSLLVDPIKASLHLSDTEMGLLTGFAFGIFYATLGVPIARVADRSNRPNIITSAIALCGATIMSCFFVQTFLQLLVTRVIASVGEVGCMPPTYSLLADYFSGAKERVRAMSIYWLAPPISSLLGFIGGGWLAVHYGWRMSFVFLGIPSVLLALVVKVTILEPRGRSVLASWDGAPSLPALGFVARTLWDQRSARHLCMAIVLLTTMGQGAAPWYAAFMLRSHGMTVSTVGLSLGLIFGLGGMGGLLIGGDTLARFFSREDRQLQITGLSVAALFPAFAAFLLANSRFAALAALVPVAIFFNVFMGPTYALMQRLVSANMRATTLALLMLVAHFIGICLGPQAIGVLSDLLRPAVGGDSLRYAMLCLSLLAPWAGYHFFLSARTVCTDLERVEIGVQGSRPADTATPTSGS